MSRGFRAAVLLYNRSWSSAILSPKTFQPHTFFTSFGRVTKSHCGRSAFVAERLFLIPSIMLYLKPFLALPKTIRSIFYSSKYHSAAITRIYRRATTKKGKIVPSFRRDGIAPLRLSPQSALSAPHAKTASLMENKYAWVRVERDQQFHQLLAPVYEAGRRKRQQRFQRYWVFRNPRQALNRCGHGWNGAAIHALSLYETPSLWSSVPHQKKDLKNKSSLTRLKFPGLITMIRLGSPSADEPRQQEKVGLINGRPLPS